MLDTLFDILSDPRFISLAAVLVGLVILRDTVRAILYIFDTARGRQRRRRDG